MDFTQILNPQPKFDVPTHRHHRAVLIKSNMRDFTQRPALQPGSFDQVHKMKIFGLPMKKSGQGLQGFAPTHLQGSQQGREGGIV
jgi:hypothetical protein